jgi:hypothetical protein
VGAAGERQRRLAVVLGDRCVLVPDAEGPQGGMCGHRWWLAGMHIHVACPVISVPRGVQAHSLRCCEVDRAGQSRHGEVSFAGRPGASYGGRVVIPALVPPEPARDATAMDALDASAERNVELVPQVGPETVE